MWRQAVGLAATNLLQGGYGEMGNIFSDYPDIVTVTKLQAMLRIGRDFAYRQRENPCASQQDEEQVELQDASSAYGNRRASSGVKTPSG
jgi:hypothetical protein